MGSNTIMPPPPPGFIPENQYKQQSLAGNQSPPPPPGFVREDQAPLDLWIKQLGGRLPMQGPLPSLLQSGFITEDMYVSPQRIVRNDEIKRRNAYEQLRNRGFSDEQISGAVAYQQATRPPSQIPQTIGALAGTLLLGRLIPGPADDAALLYRFVRGTAQALSAGTGATIAKAVQQWADPDMEFNKSELANTFGKETALEAGTLGMAHIGKRILNPVIKTILPGAKALSEKVARTGENLGLKKPTRFLPAQFSENELIDTLQGIGEGGLIDPGILMAYKKNQVIAATKIIDDVSDSIAKSVKNMTPQQTANLILDSVENRGISHKVIGERLYESAADAVGDATVNISYFKSVSKSIQEQAKKSSNIGMSGESSRLLRQITAGMSPAAERFGTSVPSLIDFRDAQNIRSGLLDIVRKGSSKLNPDPKSVSIAQRLIKPIDDAMEQAAKDAGPEAYAKWRRANWFHKAGKERYHNKLINKLIHELPDNPDAAKAIFINEENILRVRKAIGQGEFQKVKKAWFDSIVTDSMIKSPADVTVETGIGEPVGKKILKSFNSIGQPSLDAAFTKAEQENIREAARILTIVQEKTGGHSGALRFVQGSALIGVLASPLYSDYPGGNAALATSGLILIGPTALSRLMTKPWFSRLLSEGYKAPAGSQKFIALNTRLLRNILNTRKELNDERTQRRVNELNAKPLSVGELQRMGP